MGRGSVQQGPRGGDKQVLEPWTGSLELKYHAVPSCPFWGWACLGDSFGVPLMTPKGHCPPIFHLGPLPLPPISKRPRAPATMGLPTGPARPFLWGWTSLSQLRLGKFISCPEAAPPVSRLGKGCGHPHPPRGQESVCALPHSSPSSSSSPLLREGHTSSNSLLLGLVASQPPPSSTVRLPE